MAPFKYRMHLADGEDLGDYASTEPNWKPGDELEAHYAATPYRSGTDYVFAHPESGSRLEITKWYPEQFRAALTAAGITDYVRSFHDQRHNALTNMAKAGSSPLAIMAPPDTGRSRRRSTTCTWQVRRSRKTPPRSSNECSRGRKFYPPEPI